MLDTACSIETPEGIDLALRPAGPVPRILAYGIDLVIRWAIMFVIAMLMGFAGQLGMGMMMILYFLLEWFYPVCFERFRDGVTPGKKSMDLRVVNDDGTPVGWDGAIVRNLLRAADFLPFFYVVGLVSMVTSRHFRRLGDLAAGTLVVHNAGIKPPAPVDETGTRPAPVPLSDDEQRALLDFSESRNRLSPQRQAELADILTPLTGKSGKAGVLEVMRIANGLKGQA
ncbi:hypothetical protein Tel_05230 [Candidatus Tenderia electrophaga]|jgi:uncharacterized RDD family membrane protein YckC|uniref:RDD domain-containing protein n=1 Tax=Candidatus Tenderia electrophaga TaxID=1748243 RepID=A0A0S2TBQ6_9GAMM|nr:hypothetical protein Tel_05230 [Candidatus Tenderia electrophaga]